MPEQPQPLHPNGQQQERTPQPCGEGQETMRGPTGQAIPAASREGQRTATRPGADGQSTTYRHPSKPADGQ
jgi:hypothetical protein